MTNKAMPEPSARVKGWLQVNPDAQAYIDSLRSYAEGLRDRLTTEQKAHRLAHQQWLDVREQRDGFKRERDDLQKRLQQQGNEKLEEAARDGELARLMDLIGIRHSMEHPISDPEQPYYMLVKAAGKGSAVCHGRTPRQAAQRAWRWIEANDPAALNPVRALKLSDQQPVSTSQEGKK